jgi:hypothetical protein
MFEYYLEELWLQRVKLRSLSRGILQKLNIIICLK